MASSSSNNDDDEPAWSPMMCLPRAPLTPSGLLRLDTNDGEVELLRRDDMELRCSGEPMIQLDSRTNRATTTAANAVWVDRNCHVTVTVTTHRIVIQKKRQAQFLHLSNVHQVELAGFGSGIMSLTKSAKIALYTYLGELLLVFRSSTAPSASFTATTTSDRDEMLQTLQKALERRAWTNASRLQAKTRDKTTLHNRVGVDAILTKNAMRHKQAAKLSDSAFQGDADNLLREATELVAVIQKYVATLEQNKASDKDQQEEDTTKLTDMLQDMGMTSALSKQAYKSSDDYYSALARQLADFLRPKLKLTGGIMTLTDVYCYFNRARGTNLVSPDDLLMAIERMSTLSNLGISQRDFPSGVKVVVQDDALDDDVMATKLLDLLKSNGNITAMEAGRALHMTTLLANEQLLSAERMGYLCRDVTLETTRFYPNRFKDF